MRKGFLIYEEMSKYLTIYVWGGRKPHMTLQLLHSEFPYISGKFYFFLSVLQAPSFPYFIREGNKGYMGCDSTKHRGRRLEQRLKLKMACRPHSFINRSSWHKAFVLHMMWWKSPMANHQREFWIVFFLNDGDNFLRFVIAMFSKEAQQPEENSDF